MSTETTTPAQAAQTRFVALIDLINDMSAAAAATPGVFGTLARQLDEASQLAATLAPGIKAAAEQERRHAAAAEEVFGEGEHEYRVMVTLQTTATRTMRILADDRDAAEETAASVAEEEQGAFFEMNEGNYVGSDDISINSVMDTDENEFAPDEDYMSIADQIAAQTETNAADWTSTEGPSTGVGIEYWYVNEKTGQEAYVCVDQGEFSCSVKNIGEDDDEGHAAPAI